MTTPISIQSTPLVKAAEQNSLKRVQELLLAGHNPNEGNKYENSALAEAIFHGNIPMIKWFLQYGADPNAPESEGFSALYELVLSPSSRSYCILKRLLKAGADANTVVMKRPLLFHAILHKNSKAVRILLKYGADPNLAKEGKVTPLMTAAYFADISIMEMLLKHGADVNARDGSGCNALFYVVMGDCPWQEILPRFKLLFKYGIDLHAQEEHDKNILQFGSRLDNATKRWLRKHGVKE